MPDSIRLQMPPANWSIWSLLAFGRFRDLLEGNLVAGKWDPHWA
jgi:hypothetical protein